MICHVPAQHPTAHFLQGILKIRLSRGSIHIRGVHHFLQITLQHTHDGISADIHTKCRGNRLGIHGNHILEIQSCFIFFVKSTAREHVHFRIFQLCLHNVRILRRSNHRKGQVLGIGHTGRQCRGVGAFPGADNTHDFQGYACFDHRFHVICITGKIFPNTILFIMAINPRHIHQSHLHIQQVLIGPLFQFGNRIYCLTAADVVHDGIQQIRIFQSKCVGHIVRNLTGIRQHHNQFIITFRPATFQNFILGFQHLPIIDHLVEHISFHQAGHNGIAHDLIKKRRRIGLLDSIFRIRQINPGLNTIAILNGTDRMGNLVIVFIQMYLQRCQIVGADLGKHLSNHLLLHHNLVFRLRCPGNRCAKCCKHRTHVRSFCGDRQRVV